MNLLDTLRARNPELKLYSVYDAEFLSYGRVLDCKAPEELSAALDAMPIPERGNSYVASDASLEATAAAKEAERVVFGGMATEAGCCNGHGFTLNALEYHKCSEVNFSTTGLVLLLALPTDMEDGKLDSSAIRGFYLPAGVMIEVLPTVLHFAPCRISAKGFRCLVILERGVNSPLNAVNTNADGEEKLLWMRGKWMTCHPDSPQAQKGAFVGIRGENLKLEI